MLVPTRIPRPQGVCLLSLCYFGFFFSPPLSTLSGSYAQRPSLQRHAGLPPTLLWPLAAEVRHSR